MKDLCGRVKDSHRRNLRTSNCAKECQLNRAKQRGVKDNSYKLSEKPTVKGRSIAGFLLTNPYCRTDSVPGLLILEKPSLILSNQR